MEHNLQHALQPFVIKAYFRWWPKAWYPSWKNQSTLFVP